MKFSTLVTVKQLTEALCKSHKNLRVLDSSWHMPATNRNPYAEYLEGHIPGSLFFDIEDCVDKKSKYDHMLPTPSDFEKYVGKLGINNNTHVILYDNNEVGLFSAPRVWWTFRVFGHNAVSILDGGLPRWHAEGQPVTKEIKSVDQETFQAKFNPDAVKSFEDMLKNIGERKFQMADARPSGRFYGTEPEPRAGTLRTCHSCHKNSKYWNIFVRANSAHPYKIVPESRNCSGHTMRAIPCASFAL